MDCHRFTSDVLDLRGDRAGAKDSYAKAAKLAPSITSGYYSWGMARDKHGDLDGAAAKFNHANHKGPQWADPLKACGNVLVQQSKPEEALARSGVDAVKKLAKASSPKIQYTRLMLEKHD